MAKINMNYLIYIVLGLAPSIIWLLFYLRKDTHPESNKMVLKIFFIGMLVTIPTALAEIGIFYTLAGGKDIMDDVWRQNFPFLSLIYGFLGIALIEEFLKYLIVRQKVLNDPEFDEPVDVMLYMIIAALGFAALENIFYLLPSGENPEILLTTVFTSLFRFLGATFLHSLCSGIFGYFLALSFLNIKKSFRFVVLGLTTATVLHGLFNLSIMKIGDSLAKDPQTGNPVIANPQLFVFSLLFLIILLSGLAFFVSLGFKKIKKLASVCKVHPVK